ncbi:aldehyde dehydrogenase family protein, partial [bacterium]|nr:aldehyde dehydrogenase family protein [bacterium]
METIHHLIDGVASPSASGVTKPVFNPATGEQTASLAMASLAEVDAAVASSQAAFQEWRHV